MKDIFTEKTVGIGPATACSPDPIIVSPTRDRSHIFRMIK